MKINKRKKTLGLCIIILLLITISSTIFFKSYSKEIIDDVDAQTPVTENITDACEIVDGKFDFSIKARKNPSGTYAILGTFEVLDSPEKVTAADGSNTITLPIKTTALRSTGAYIKNYSEGGGSIEFNSLFATDLSLTNEDTATVITRFTELANITVPANESVIIERESSEIQFKTSKGICNYKFYANVEIKGQRTNNPSQNKYCKELLYPQTHDIGTPYTYNGQRTTLKELYEKHLGGNNYDNKIALYFQRNLTNHYCSQPSTTEYWSDSALKRLIQTAIDEVSSNDQNSLSGNLSEEFKKLYYDSGAVDSDNVNGSKTNLWCNEDINALKSKTNIKKLYRHEGKEKKEYVNYGTGNQLACESKCYEVVEVSYGPPVSAIGGMCFEYQIKVSTRSECTLKKHAFNPPPVTTCTFDISCNGRRTGKWQRQAGPSEDFDQCISQCDDGNYSQNCIDKCYKKVYENSETNITDSAENKLKLYNNRSSKVLKLANTSNPTNRSCTNLDTLAKDLYEWYQDPDHWGKFTKGSCNSNNGICYIPKSFNKWDKYAYIYFDTYENAKRTVYGECGYQYFLPNGVLYDRFTDYYASTDSSDMGIKRSASCTDYCEYTKQGEDPCYYNNDEAEAKIKEYQDLYEDAVEKCQTSEVCQQGTTTYYLTVKNANPKSETDSLKDKGVCAYDPRSNLINNQCSQWNWKATTNNNTGTEVKNSPGGPNPVILNNVEGTCYGNDEAYWNYSTMLSFPDLWINNKNGDQTHNLPQSLDGWVPHENEYCLPYNISNQNVGHFIWNKIYNQNSAAYLADNFPNVISDYHHKPDNSESVENGGKVNYNIKGIIENFGLFKWNFDISCFYSAYNGPVTVANSVTRALSLNDLFAGKGTINRDGVYSKNQTNNNYIPFNWSYRATHIAINGNKYEIFPEGLEKKITSQGNSVYNDAKELDYSITLTSNQISNIKKNINNNNTGYTYSSNSITSKKTGIKTYKSNYLDEYTDVKKRPKDYGCNNTYDGECYNLFNYSTYTEGTKFKDMYDDKK